MANRKKKTDEQRKKSAKRLTILQHLIAVVLAVVLLFPFVQNLQHDARVEAEIEEFRKQDNEEEVANMKKENEDINESGQFYTADPFAGQTKYEDRANMLGVLTIPKIDEELTVYDRTDNLSLDEGVGLLEGTNKPTGGKDNTSVLTGHDGMAEATIFKNIDLLEDGDTFTFDNGSEVLTYEVYDEVVVLPHETDFIQQIKGQDTMILLTCETPDITKGINTHRLLIFARRVPTEDKTETPEIKPVTSHNRRHTLMGISGITILVGVVGSAGYRYIKKK